jgi:hypothetical protein
MPRARVRNYSDIHARLSEVSDESEAELHAVIRAKTFMLRLSDSSSLTSEQSNQAYVSDVVTSLYLMAIGDETSRACTATSAVLRRMRSSMPLLHRQRRSRTLKR